MLQNPLNPGYAATAPAGQDGKFGAIDLISVIYNNRTWYAEEFLPELRERCEIIGNNQVSLASGGLRSVSSACDVLQSWNGVYDVESVGAHVFRVFIANYRNSFGSDLTTPFNPQDPVMTPASPSVVGKGTSSDAMLMSLAEGLEALDSVGIEYDAALGDVQYYQASGGVPPGGVAVDQLHSFPWHGGDGSVDGAFNAIGVVTSPVAEDTVFPRVAANVLSNTAGLSDQPGEGWRMARGTSWHFGLEFADDGPQAYGLLSYSQSSNEMSPYFNDQAQRYSEKNYRKLFFTEGEIEANLIPNGTVTITNRD